MKWVEINAVLLLTILYGFYGNGDACPMNVGAFNIKVFGVTKMGKPHVVELLKQILVRYDIVLIQEIRDASNTAIYNLLGEINSLGVGTWNMELSIRLGRTSSKEQYAFFYKPAVVQVVGTYQWPDVNDVFEREPYIVLFKPAANTFSIDTFAVLGLHVKPDDAVNELDNLTQVYDSVSAMWGVQDMILAGDFNADCSYVTSSEWPHVSLRQDPRFLWMIADHIDTTIYSTDCAYDRLVLAGPNLRKHYVPDSARPFHFDQVYGINETLAKAVSDHYPVEILVR